MAQTMHNACAMHDIVPCMMLFIVAYYPTYLSVNLLGPGLELCYQHKTHTLELAVVDLNVTSDEGNSLASSTLHTLDVQWLLADSACKGSASCSPGPNPHGSHQATTAAPSISCNRCVQCCRQAAIASGHLA